MNIFAAVGRVFLTFLALRSELPFGPEWEYPLRVVVVSAVHDPSNVRKALDLGALGYIPKSAQGDVIISALRLVISE
jgi:DNA-binding NarL/FixJ family response regulator